MAVTLSFSRGGVPLPPLSVDFAVAGCSPRPQLFVAVSVVFVVVSFVAGTVVSPVAAVAAVAAPVAAGSTSCEQFFTLRLFPMEEIRVPSVFALSVVVYCEVVVLYRG